MSFILDALRKSEHARQQERGPALAEVPVAVARPRTNVWATAAVVLLVVNLVAVGVLLLRRAQHEAPASNGAAPATSVAPPAAPAPAAPTSAGSPPAPAPQASMTQTLPQPVLREPAEAAPMPDSGGRNPLEQEVSGGAPPGVDAAIAARAASVPEGPPAVQRTTAPTPPVQRGSVVYQSAPESDTSTATATEPGAGTGSGAPSTAGLPTADEMVARGVVPNLHIDLHVYSTRPQDRFIFVNSHRYREGDTMQEGPVVEEITRNGAVLSYRGNRFLLSND